MSFFYIAIAAAVASAFFGYDRFAELMLAAAAVIGYMDTRLPRDISVTLVRKDAGERP